MAICGCHPCGCTFTSLSAFDQHHRTDYTQRPAVTCLDPAAAGLVLQPSGRWSLPPTDKSRARTAAIRAERDSEKPRQ